MNISDDEKTFLEALAGQHEVLPKQHHTPEREQQIYDEIKDIDFVKKLLDGYRSYEPSAYMVKHFKPENLWIRYYDGFGRCAIGFILEDWWAVRDEKGNWKEVYQHEQENLIEQWQNTDTVQTIQ